jgi:hypothetical protein
VAHFLDVDAAGFEHVACSLTVVAAFFQLFCSPQFIVEEWKIVYFLKV